MKEKTKRTKTNKPICSKNNKGITLIALILTIIVLLILAVVAINAVKGDGIISHAKNAKADYTKAQKNEQDMLLQYEHEIEKSQGMETEDAWKQEKTKVTKGNTTLNVGDTITNFKAGNKTWKVLGAENGKLLLTTTENVVASKTISGSDATLGVWDEKTSSYKNAEDALDKACTDAITLADLTDEIKSKVTEVRSIKVEDIDRVTGYDPKIAKNGKPYGAGEVWQYGNKVTYSMNASGKVAYNSATAKSEGTNYTKFWAPNTSANITSPYTVTSTFYGYDVDTDTNLAKGSDAYSLLFGNDDQYYWLASSFVRAYEGNAYFGLRNVNSGDVSFSSLWRSGGGGNRYTYGVRPVVSLASDFQPVK